VLYDVAMSTVLGALMLRWWAIVAVAALDFGDQRRREPLVASVIELPPVTVLIPAYNEAAVIEATVSSVLASDLPQLRVVVIDDGSSDGTADVVRNMGIAQVSVLEMPKNGGKAAALRYGMANTTDDVVITVDADTRVATTCLPILVRTLIARASDAVCANVKVTNRAGAVGQWQSLEYIAGLNLDRRAQARLRVITTVPGAAAAWRRAAVEAVGGFSSDTLAEDTDLTLALLRTGRRIAFADRAICYTEAPSTWSQLRRQRLRWLHGNLQCARKHSAAWWTPSPLRVRLLALPNLWYAHLGSYLIYPLAIAWLFASRPAADAVIALLIGAVVSIDLVIMAIAMRADREPLSALVHAPGQRLLYPAFLWSVFATVMVRVVLGRVTAWDKLERLGAKRSAKLDDQR